MEENSIRNPLLLHEVEDLDLKDFYWVFDEDIGLMQVPYAGHAIAMSALLAFREGYASIEDMALQNPKMFDLTKNFDIKSIGQELYLQKYPVCYFTICSSNLQVWSDSSISYFAMKVFKAKGFDFFYVGEHR